MPGIRMYKPVFAFLFIASAVVSCANTTGYSPLLRAEPAAGSVLNRAPRNLRLYYGALPDVPNSRLKLSGPEGEYELRGFHTMGADDLMIEITNPSIPDGDYVVSWTAVVGDDPSVYEGSYNFSVVTDR